MNNSKILLSPISRLTLFLAVGIFFSDTLLRCHNYLIVHIILLLFLTLSSIILYYKRANISFGISTALFALIFGSMLTNIKWLETEHEWSKENRSYYGVIADEVVDKGKYIQFVADVDKSKVLTRVLKDSIDLNFKAGDAVAFYGKIKRPFNMGNPFEIDYASYLLHNNINGTIFLQDDEIKIIAHNSKRDLKYNALAVRHRIIDRFREWGIKGDELALLSALMVGEKNLFSEEIEENYSKSGLSHILCISGMHVGIILLIINSILWFMNSRGVLRFAKWIIIATILWAFAYISGLSPSVVRAVIMCLLLELMFFSHEKRNPLNIIFATALCMLIYNPFYLFDISFQLSFAAVLSILIFYSTILNILQCRYNIINRFSTIIALSISAQIGAAPIVIYYFSNFSTYFLLSNILSSYLIIAIMLLALLSFVIPLNFIHVLLNIALNAQNMISSQVASLPNSVVRIDNFSIVNIVFIYIFFMLALIYYYNRLRKYLIGVYITILLFISFNVIIGVSHTVEPHALIYTDSGASYIHFVEDRDKSIILSSSRDSLNIHPRPAVKRYCYKEGIKEPDAATNLHSSYIYSKDGIILWRGKRLCIISDNRWRNRHTTDRLLEIDCLYINRGFYGTISSLEKVFKIKQIVLGFSLSDTYVETITKECMDRGIPLVNLKEVGYYKIMV